MKYASSLDLISKKYKNLLNPWKLKGLIIYNSISEIPEDSILVFAHFQPWKEPLKSYIESGRPYIEIEYGYWGIGGPRSKPRRVTYNNFNNIKYNTFISDRTILFQTPEIFQAHQ